MGLWPHISARLIGFLFPVVLLRPLEVIASTFKFNLLVKFATFCVVPGPHLFGPKLAIAKGLLMSLSMLTLSIRS